MTNAGGGDWRVLRNGIFRHEKGRARGSYREGKISEIRNKGKKKKIRRKN